MKTIFCIRPKGFNIGNELIFNAMQFFLREALGDEINLITLPATSRFESEAKAGFSPKTVYEINQLGHAVIVGGGNLYENNQLDVNLNALETLEPPMMLFSLSMGKIYNPRGKLTRRTDSMPDATIKALNEKAHYSLARDQATYDHIKGLGGDDVILGGCPTLYINEFIEDIPTFFPTDIVDNNTALISVRHPELMSIPTNKRAQVYNDVKDIFDCLQKHGYEDIRFLCHDHRDISFASTFNDIDYIFPNDVFSYLSMVKRCGLLVSYRLHSVLPRVSYSKPTIPIIYDERTLSMYETVGLNESTINMIHTDTIKDELEKYIQEKSFNTHVKDPENKKVSALRKTIQDSFKSFAKDIEKYFERYP